MLGTCWCSVAAQKRGCSSHPSVGALTCASPPSHWVVALPREEEKLISDPPAVSFLSLLGLQVSAWLGSAQLGPGPHWPLGGAARKAYALAKVESSWPGRFLRPMCGETKLVAETRASAVGGEKQTRRAHRPPVWARLVPNALLLGQGLAAWVGVFRWLQGWARKETAGADMSLWGGGGAMEKDSFGVQEIKRFLCEG